MGNLRKDGFKDEETLYKIVELQTLISDIIHNVPIHITEETEYENKFYEFNGYEQVENLIRSIHKKVDDDVDRNLHAVHKFISLLKEYVVDRGLEIK